jgi:hypothetical protein
LLLWDYDLFYVHFQPSSPSVLEFGFFHVWWSTNFQKWLEYIVKVFVMNFGMLVIVLISLN